MKRGDRLVWNGHHCIDIHVTRVAKDQSWADVFAYDNRARTSWTTRLKLPLTGEFKEVS